MTAEIGMWSWNIRGIKNLIKKNAMFAELARCGPLIVCLQETHLTKDTVSLIQNKKYPIQYHSVYSAYARGTSILISSKAQVSCRQAVVDPQGRFILLVCTLAMYFGVNIYPTPI